MLPINVAKIIQVRGFSLLELLLVISLLGILSISGMLTFRHYMDNKRIEIASHQMQDFMQAAQNYLMQEGDWPQDNNLTPECADIAGDAHSRFIAYYVPNHSNQTHYGSYYCYGKSQAPDTAGLWYWIAMQAPLNDEKLAKRIAANLPNAILTKDPNSNDTQPCVDHETCYIRAGVPGIATTSMQQGLIGAGVCPTRLNAVLPGSAVGMSCRYLGDTNEGSELHYQVQFHCHHNNVPTVLFTPTAFNAGASSPSSTNSLWKLLPAVQCASSDENQNKVDCNGAIQILRNNHDGLLSGRGHGSITFSYIALCLGTGAHT